MTPVIETLRQGKLGRIVVNLTRSRRALDADACEAIRLSLANWLYDPEIELVIFDRNRDNRDFCASGNQAILGQDAHANSVDCADFWEEYFRLCDVIANYPKPYIAILDGNTVDTGLGVSFLGAAQIVTERASVSFPETGYGFALCGGVSRVLSQLEDEMGTWLALTGAKLQGREIVTSGLASHFCRSEVLDQLIERFAAEGLSALETLPPITLPAFVYRGEVQRTFSGSCARVILRRLEAGSGWAKSQATKLKAKSPLSSKIVLRQLRTSQLTDSTSTALKLEYRVISRLINSRNLLEGIRAQFEDMDYWPDWQPRTLVGTSGDMVAKYFSPILSGELCLDEFMPRLESSARSLDFAQRPF